ncbi:ankyrin repeat-containing domain protein [Microdochium trichocladiopsis]|uniref:Ankyrin repeat-containing domain protein n=1 Tax=Microdochium trichocladiopsis TaxID=1682393 RepID=A0A9P8XUM7_9PEZI|nr:ankyrin repeat-containing domain protein [Microdochium trichocladiopsis]KAH7016244.1 ankyrin repeat-containing domain protein [Microdochium trichocladiopsis]
MYSSDKLDKIRTWLSPSDPSTNLHKARRQRYQGTGQWFLESHEYAKWKKERNSFLWLNGIPGCGKTVLSSSVVADLEQSVSSLSLLYFYFDFNDATKQSTDDALRSLIDQLYNQRTELQKEVDALFSSCKNGRRQPESASLFKTFRSLLQQAGETWIVLDALDECHKRNDGLTGGLLPWIRGLRDASLNVHLLVTSRPEQDIRSSIESWSQVGEVISLQNGRTSNDINAYIKAQTAEMSRWEDRPDIREKIESELSQKANGMFRWVSCQIDVLRECLAPKSVFRELNNLPPTLDATYARILQNIRPEHMDCAKRLLQFLAYSERPLRIEEAVDALAVDPDCQPRFDPRNRMPDAEEVARYCSSLVVLVRQEDHRSGTMIVEIQLAHFSVQEYLVSARVHESMAADLEKTNAKAEIVRVCLSYLIDNASRDTLQETEGTPLANFAAQYWSTYAVDVELSRKEVLSEVDEYFSSEVAFQFGHDLCDTDNQWGRQDEIQRWGPGRRHAPTALYFASFVGLFHSVQMLLDKGADIDAESGPYGNALQAASSRGHREVVQLLLDKGANINAQGGYYRNALQAASFRGHREVVQLLLDKGADINAQGGYYSNALQAASYGGDREVVQLLLDKGADVNAQGGDYGNALQAASHEGHREIVQLLLDNGADVNAQGGLFGNALQAASYGGDREVVQLLLDKGADVNAQGGLFGNALQAASSWGHREIIQLLLDNGADVNAWGGV